MGRGDIRQRLLLSVVVFMALCAFACHGVNQSERREDTLDRISREKLLRVGYVVWPPTVQNDPNTGRLSGHFIDTVDYIGKELGIRVEYHEATFATFIAGLETQQYDLAVVGAYKTIPRAEVVAFTRALLYIGNAVIVRREETRFSTLDSLNRKGVKIAVAQGTGEHAYAQQHLRNADIIALPSSDLTLPLVQVISGRADLAISDSFTISQFADHHKEVKTLFLDKPFNLAPVAWCVRPDDLRFLHFLDDSLEYLEFSGRIEEFEAKYHASWLHLKHDWYRPQ